MRRLYYLLIFLISNQAMASLYLQYSGVYYTQTDDASVSDAAVTEGASDANDGEFEYTSTYNMLYIAASVDSKKKKLYLGYNVVNWSKTQTKGADDQESEVSLLEMGPRLLFFFNQEKTWYISAAWHPYVQGERTLSGVSEDISGSAYLFSFGYHFKITKKFFMGGSVTYHQTSIEQETINETKTDIGDSYTTIMPMLEFSYRFK